jgi:hypothetical protein
VLGTPAPAHAIDEISIRPAAEAPVQLLRPAPGEDLVSGRQTTIEWRARRDLPAESIVEWEAFISFDGGASWPVRATPHLDVSVKRFDFTIPLAPSDDVRIMLRFGDERREVGYVLPTVYRSVVRTRAWTPSLSPEPVLDRGEPALPGAAGVVFWVEGARDGRCIVARAAECRPVSANPPRSSGGPSWPMFVPPDQRAIDLAARIAPWDLNRPAANTATRRAAEYILPLLLLVCRRNE